jgi:3-hydroxyisobutyrate dehydrogenase-like beta-hydroxyacid dehydrogenase
MDDRTQPTRPPGTGHIGWIGVGVMGLPICANLIRHGFRVLAFDSAPERLDLAAQIGADRAASVRGVAEHADMVFSMVYDDAALEGLVTSADGLLAGCRPGMLYVDMSTVSPGLSAEMAALLARQSVRYLRAPVSGSVGMATAATLSVLVSGDTEDLAACEAVLKAMSSAQHHVGPGEAARVIKLVVNMMLVNATVLIGEALKFGEQSGVPRAVLVQAINQSIVGSRHYAARADSLVSRRYGSAGPVRMAAKDMALALDIAQAQQIALPMAQAC